MVEESASSAVSDPADLKWDIHSLRTLDEGAIMGRLTTDTTDIRSSRRLLIVPLILFLLSTLTASAIIYRLELYRQAIEHARVLSIANTRADLLQENINRALSATYSVAALIRKGGGSFPDFVPTVAQLLPFYPGVSSLDMAPGGVISAIVPAAGNEKAVGFDILNDPTQKVEAIKARDSGELTLAGPLELVEGGLGAVGRLPVFLDDDKGNKIFWGLTCVVLKFPDVLVPASLDELAGEGYQYELWRIHPDSGKKQTIAASSADPLTDPAEYSLKLPNGKWTLSIAPAKGWGDPASLMLKAFLGLMVSLIIAFAAFLLVKLKAHKRELEAKVFQRTAELEKEVYQRRIVARELEEHSEYNRALLDSISSNVAILNRDGVIISVNSAWLKFGRENSCSGELPDISNVGGNYLDVCRKAINEGEPFVREAYEGINSVLNGSSQLFELDYVCDKDEIGTDTDHWYCMTVEPLKVDGGGAVVMHVDISERKLIENTLRHSETKLRTLYDSTADALMLLDETGFFDCNDATLEVFGCGTRNDFYAKHPADFSPELQPCGSNSLELCRQKISAAMKLGCLHFEWVHTRYDSGATFPADVLLSAMVLNGRTVLQATVRDISEREKTNASLYKLSQAVEQSPVTIVITDVAGRIEFVNPKFTQMTGYSADEAIGQNPRILKSGETSPDVYNKLWRTITSGNVWNGEFINKNRNGDIFWEQATISPLKNKTGKIVNF